MQIVQQIKSHGERNAIKNGRKMTFIKLLNQLYLRGNTLQGNYFFMKQKFLFFKFFYDFFWGFLFL